MKRVFLITPILMPLIAYSQNYAGVMFDGNGTNTGKAQVISVLEETKNSEKRGCIQIRTVSKSFNIGSGSRPLPLGVSKACFNVNDESDQQKLHEIRRAFSVNKGNPEFHAAISSALSFDISLQKQLISSSEKIENKEINLSRVIVDVYPFSETKNVCEDADSSQTSVTNEYFRKLESEIVPFHKSKKSNQNYINEAKSGFILDSNKKVNALIASLNEDKNFGESEKNRLLREIRDIENIVQKFASNTEVVLPSNLSEYLTRKCTNFRSSLPNYLKSQARRGYNPDKGNFVKILSSTLKQYQRTCKAYTARLVATESDKKVSTAYINIFSKVKESALSDKDKLLMLNALTSGQKINTDFSYFELYQSLRDDAGYLVDRYKETEASYTSSDRYSASYYRATREAKKKYTFAAVQNYISELDNKKYIKEKCEEIKAGRNSLSPANSTEPSNKGGTGVVH